MNARFQDQQDAQNPRNGSVLHGPDDVVPLFESLRGRTPFLFELVGDSGYKLTAGYSETLGCVQYSPSDGKPPYLMAADDAAEDGGDYVEFLAGGTPTPIPKRYCLPIDLVQAVVVEFMGSGGKSPMVAWEEV